MDMVLTDMAWRVVEVQVDEATDLILRQKAQAEMMATLTTVQKAALAKRILQTLKDGGPEAARLLKLSPWEWF
jgi:hypothetical protein